MTLGTTTHVFYDVNTSMTYFLGYLMFMQHHMTRNPFNTPSELRLQTRERPDECQVAESSGQTLLVELVRPNVLPTQISKSKVGILVADDPTQQHLAEPQRVWPH